jgi:hypothetical protein
MGASMYKRPAPGRGNGALVHAKPRGTRQKELLHPLRAIPVMRMLWPRLFLAVDVLQQINDLVRIPPLIVVP